MYTTLRAAAISFKPIKWDKPANADRLEHFFSRAARTKSQLLLAPEGVLEGYAVVDMLRDASRARDLPSASGAKRSTPRFSSISAGASAANITRANSPKGITRRGTSIVLAPRCARSRRRSAARDL